MGQHNSEYVFAGDFALEERHCPVQLIEGAGCAKKLTGRNAPLIEELAGLCAGCARGARTAMNRKRSENKVITDDFDGRFVLEPA